MTRRTRAQLVRDPTLRVGIRSNAGDDRPHQLVLELYVVGRNGEFNAPERTLRVSGTGMRRLTLRLPRRALAILRGREIATIAVTAQQRVGSGIRSSRGFFAGDAVVFRR